MKCRPRLVILEGTLKALKSKDPDLIPVGIGVDIIGWIISSALKSTAYRCCNAACEESFVVEEEGKQAPRFCKKCGTEFDWSPLPAPTRKAILCPTCGKEYYSTDRFCEVDGSKLIERQLPI